MSLASIFIFFWGRLPFFIFLGRLPFFLGRLSSSVKIRLHTKNQLYTLPESALKVFVVGGGGWVLKVNLVISFGFGQAEQNVKRLCCGSFKPLSISTHFVNFPWFWSKIMHFMNINNSLRLSKSIQFVSLIAKIEPMFEKLNQIMVVTITCLWILWLMVGFS